MIRIIADSTCDLSPEIIKDLNIKILPLIVSFNEEAYRDGFDLDSTKLYELVDKYNILPKTSAIAPGVIEEAYLEILNQGDDIIFFTISSYFSSVYQNALMVKESLDEKYRSRITVIDSHSLSSGIGIQIVHAGRLIAQGKSLVEIEIDALATRGLVVAEFVAERLDYLYKGGRCSGLAYFFGKPLKIKPVIRVVDGQMGVHKLVRGKDGKKGWDLQLQEIADEVKKNNVIFEDVFITHSIAPNGVKYIRERLMKIVPPEVISETSAGCVISSHCGPGTIGILYIKKK